MPRGTGYRFDLSATAALDLPVVNVGPAGGGAHTESEWVDEDIAFRRLPRLLVRLARELVGPIQI